MSCALRFYCHKNSEVGLLVGTVCAECYTCYLHSRRLDSVGCCCGTWSARVHAAVSGCGNIPGACCFLTEAVDVRTLTVDTVAFISVSWGVNEHEHVTGKYFNHVLLIVWLAHISWRIKVSRQCIVVRNDAGNTAHSLCCLIAFCRFLARGKEQKVHYVILPQINFSSTCIDVTDGCFNIKSLVLNVGFVGKELRCCRLRHFRIRTSSITPHHTGLPLQSVA